MANFIDQFKFSLRGELEAVERELVQTVSERALREGDSFPGTVDTIEAKIVVDLNKVQRTAESCRFVRQIEGKEE